MQNPRQRYCPLARDGSEPRPEEASKRSIIYQKNCLGYDYEKPVQIRGDIRIIFYEKLIGGCLFYACFNTAFITSSLLQFSLRELDKVGKKRQINLSFFILLGALLRSIQR